MKRTNPKKKKPLFIDRGLTDEATGMIFKEELEIPILSTESSEDRLCMSYLVDETEYTEFIQYEILIHNSAVDISKLDQWNPDKTEDEIEIFKDITDLIVSGTVNVIFRFKGIKSNGVVLNHYCWNKESIRDCISILIVKDDTTEEYIEEILKKYVK